MVYCSQRGCLPPPCTCALLRLQSRNRTVGIRLGKGERLEDITATMGVSRRPGTGLHEVGRWTCGVHLLRSLCAVLPCCHSLRRGPTPPLPPLGPRAGRRGRGRADVPQRAPPGAEEGHRLPGHLRHLQVGVGGAGPGVDATEGPGGNEGPQKCEEGVGLLK